MGMERDVLEALVTEYGEVFFVLDSGIEVEVHGERGYDVTTRGGRQYLRTEGMHDGEWLIREVPIDRIEHAYSHKEV
jgi:hypothetical protein